jgi:hypothetical protein
MPAIKLYSEVTVNEKGATGGFFTISGKSLLRTFLSIFFFNRNYCIQRRITKIRKQSANTKQWCAMTDQEHVSHIYKTMAQEKAIERMLRLMD